MKAKGRIYVACGGVLGKEYPEKELTEKIIGCAIAVHRELGPGYGAYL